MIKITMTNGVIVNLGADSRAVAADILTGFSKDRKKGHLTCLSPDGLTRTIINPALILVAEYVPDDQGE